MGGQLDVGILGLSPNILFHRPATLDVQLNSISLSQPISQPLTPPRNPPSPRTSSPLPTSAARIVALLPCPSSSVYVSARLREALFVALRESTNSEASLFFLFTQKLSMKASSESRRRFDTSGTLQRVCTLSVSPTYVHSFAPACLCPLTCAHIFSFSFT